MNSVTGRWILPIFLTEKNKGKVAFIATVITVVLYLGSNHFPFFVPHLLQLSWIEQNTPFIPLTFWIYVSEYLLFFSVYKNCKDLANGNRYLYAFMALQLVSTLIFVLYPTAYPRDQFPLPQNLDGITAWAFNSLRSADSPNNCAPSLHVSSCYLSSFAFLKEQRHKFPFFFFWATAVGISTLTTKQHYLVDVVLGLVFAIVIYWIFVEKIPYRDVRK